VTKTDENREIRGERLAFKKFKTQKPKKRPPDEKLSEPAEKHTKVLSAYWRPRK